jgi:hypothetical protein
LITPDKFLDFAKRIVSAKSAPEEESRSAISRAYYSLYHETLAIMVKKYSIDLIKNIEKEWGKPLKHYERVQLNALDPTFIRKLNLHRILPDTLYDLKKPLIASSFKNFRDQRNNADYDLKLVFTCPIAYTVVNNIDALIGLMKSL